MKSILISALIIFSSVCYSQKSDCDITLNILKKVFTKYEVKYIKDHQVFVTEVWENHAIIPLKECFIVELDNGITALAFNIFMTDTPEDYENMINENIVHELEINEETKYQGTGERLIQVIFYDTKNDKFSGKPEDFPIAELSWVTEGYTYPQRTDIIKTFKKIKGCTNTILLTVQEYGGFSEGLHYFFKYHKGEILTASLRTCIESIQEQNNKLMVHHIPNCSEVDVSGAEPENVFRIILKW